eukprot:616609-Ditylum_brightwellii.AAC.1
MMSNNSSNNTSTDNASINSIGSQNDEQDHPRNEEDAGEKEEVDPNASPSSKITIDQILMMADGLLEISTVMPVHKSNISTK